MMQHPDLCRDNVELLTRRLTHQRQRRTVVRAHLLRFRQVVQDVFARQVRGQRSAMAALAGVRGDRRDGRLRVILGGCRVVDLGFRFVEQAELRVLFRHPLALRPEALGEQQTDLQPQPFNLRLMG